MTEQCTVKKIKRDIVYVELKRSDKCEGCKMCAFNKNNTMTVPAVCKHEVSVGQTVTVQMPTKSAGAATLLIYAIPLLFTVIGAVIGLAGEWWLQLTLAAVGLAIGLLSIIPIERAYRKKSGILPIVLDTGETDETNTDITNDEDN